MTVATWNLENFTTQSPAFADKLKHLKSALAAINPDVIALQEVLQLPAL